MRYEVVDGYGCQVLKHSERLIIRTPMDTEGRTSEKRDVPILHLDHLLLGARGVSITTDALTLCCERGIPVTMLDWRGRPVARFASPSFHGSAVVRRAQLMAATTELGASFARTVVQAKLLNQADNLRYFGKNRHTRAPGEHAALSAVADCLQGLAKEAQAVQGASSDEVRQPLMVVEAEAAKAYWSALHGVYGAKSGFSRREQRGTRDPVNAALNYAYGVLQAEVWNACVLAGLEPYAGLLHVDRPGRLSFVLDLIEEFRPMADRVVFALAAKGWRIDLEDNGWLAKSAKAKLIAAWSEKLESTISHEGKKVRFRSLIQLQARDAARHFLGKIRYQGMRLRW